VKIGFKFHSLGKILNISTSDPTVLLCQFQHWKCSQYKVISIQASTVLQSPLSPRRHHHSSTLIHTIFILDHPPSSFISVTSQHHKPFHTSPLYLHATFNDSSVVNLYTFHGVLLLRSPLKTFLCSKSFVLSLFYSSRLISRHGHSHKSVLVLEIIRNCNTSLCGCHDRLTQHSISDF